MSEDIKAKIRERYKGNANANIEVIPAVEQPSFYEDFSEKRVAVYARVSTGSAIWIIKPRRTLTRSASTTRQTTIPPSFPGMTSLLPSG